MNVVATGTLVEHLETIEISNGKMKHEFAFEVKEGEYAQLIKLEVWGDRIQQIKQVEVGAEMEITFDVKGRKYTNKEGKVMYFNTLGCWKWEVKKNAILADPLA